MRVSCQEIKHKDLDGAQCTNHYLLTDPSPGFTVHVHVCVTHDGGKN